MFVLSKLDAHLSWADAEQDPRATGDIACALAGFRAILGDLWNGWSKGVPLTNQFFVRFQSQCPEGVRLWRMIERLRGVPGLRDHVRHGFSSMTARDYVAAVMALEFCSSVRESGGDAEFIPRLGAKTPDAQARLVDRWITVEFKALHEHDEMEAWDALDQHILVALARRGASPREFDIQFTAAALTTPESVVEGLLSIKERGVRDYEDLPNDAGEARLASINCGWRRYPLSQKRDLDRVASKFGSWRQQLANAEGPTLLVVRTNTVFGDGTPATCSAAARRIAEVLLVHRRIPGEIGGVLLYDAPCLASAPRWHTEIDRVRASIDTSSAGYARFMALVPNPQARVPLESAELDRLAGPHAAW